MIKLLKKDLILFFNDRRSYTLTFLIPIILISLFAFAYGGFEKYSGKPESYRLLVADNDSSVLSGVFIAAIDSINTVDIIKTSIEESNKLITEGKFSAALIIRKGFMDSLLISGSPPLEMMFDKEQSFETSTLQAIIMNVMVYFYKPVQQKSSKVPVLKMTSIVGEDNNQNLGLIQSVAGTAILMLLFSVAAIGTSILEEKENGTISRLLFSPLHLRTILYGKMLFAFLISLLQLSVMFIFSWIFLGLDITADIKSLVLMIISTSFAVSSLGIFLAAIARSRQHAQSLSTLIILVMSAIGGSMIPLFIMPDIMNTLARFSVNYWSIQGFYDIFWRSLPLADILPKILLLTAIGSVLTMVSLRLFSKNIFKII